MATLMPQACARCWRRKQRVCIAWRTTSRSWLIVVCYSATASHQSASNAEKRVLRVSSVAWAWFLTQRSQMPAAISKACRSACSDSSWQQPRPELHHLQCMGYRRSNAWRRPGHDHAGDGLSSSQRDGRAARQTTNVATRTVFV
jgi:hypothetical protein